MSSRHKPASLRRLAALGAAALLSACSSDRGGGDWLAMVKAARVAWDSRDAPVALDEAAAIPYATLGLRMDGGREQILLLATDIGGERLWTSSAQVALTTRYGRIVRTAGFGTDLSGFVSRDSGREDWTKPHTYAWTADFADLGLYSITITCNVVPMGPDPITILGKAFDTIRVDEACRSAKLDWSFNDSYWISAETGRVWRSRQHFHPKGPEVEIELLRPPLSAG